MRFLYADPKHASAEPQLLDYYRKHGFLAGDKIELNLTFAPAQRVQGRFVNAEGKPVAGVEVQLGKCDYVNTAGKEDHVNYREFWAQYQAAGVMPEQFLTASDADGRFEFSSVQASNCELG